MPEIDVQRLQPIGRAGCALGVLVILYLSLVPGEIRPHVLPSGGLEHFAAYFGEALLVALSFPRLRTILCWHLGLCALSGACEIAQAFIPGRGPGLDGFLASSAGVAVALVLSLPLRRQSN